MLGNNAFKRHWRGVLRLLFVDFVIFFGAFCLGLWLRFDDTWAKELSLLWPGMLIGTCAFGCAMYTMGLYSLQNAHQSFFKRSLLVALGQVIAILLMLGIFYLNFSTRIGRGAMLISVTIAYGATLIHHAYLLQRFRNLRERVALIITCHEDEDEAALLCETSGHYLDLVGVIPHNYKPVKSFRVLGNSNELNRITNEENLERVLCTNHSMVDPKLYRQFCQLRYSGITVMPLISIFEEICHCVPMELVTPEWLLSASGSPQMLYIKKLKRGFDIVAALGGLLLGWPFLLAGMLWVKIVSPQAPVLYRQIRSGRFGKPFTLFKLRTMRPDAESGDTAIWASTQDPRAIPGGNLLRKYRIDEIPQMWNVLRGEMSCVGPRPERPQFVAQLALEIPYYQERLLIQPGITGWAQVNYSYGASIADARHKLEYDLYYTKNMSLILDVFILLDTVRIIFRGGVGKSNRIPLAQERITRRNQAATIVAQRPQPAPAHNWVV